MLARGPNDTPKNLQFIDAFNHVSPLSPFIQSSSGDLANASPVQELLGMPRAIGQQAQILRSTEVQEHGRSAFMPNAAKHAETVGGHSAATLMAGVQQGTEATGTATHLAAMVPLQGASFGETGIAQPSPAGVNFKEGQFLNSAAPESVSMPSPAVAIDEDAEAKRQRTH